MGVARPFKNGESAQPPLSDLYFKTRKTHSTWHTQTRANAAAVSQIQCWHAEQRSVYGCPGQRSAIRANSSCARADLRRHHKHHKREQNGRCQPPARCVDRERGPRHSPDNHPAGHVGALSLYVSSRLYTAGCVLAARMQATMMDSDDSRQ